MKQQKEDEGDPEGSRNNGAHDAAERNLIRARRKNCDHERRTGVEVQQTPQYGIEKK